ncbi:MAG: MFS transporter [Dehalococcoidia bacterium]
MGASVALEAVPDEGAQRGRRSVVARRLPALTAPAFRIYWCGMLVADGATFMFQITAAWLVYELTAPPLNVAVMLGVLGFCRTIPMLAFVLVGGVTADRLGRRTMLQLTNGASAAFATTFGVIALLGWMNVWLVLVAAIVMGTAMAFNRPAHQAFIRDLVPAGSLQNAVGLTALTQNVLRIGAPLLAGALLATGSGAIPLLIVASGYAVMAMLVTMIRVPQPSASNASILASLGEVFRYIRSDRLVLALLLVETIPGLFALPFATLLPIFAGSVHGHGAGGLGVMQSFVGIGALTGALLLTLMTGIRRRGVLLIGAITTFGIALIVFALTESWPLALAMLALAGFADALYILTIFGLLLAKSPEHLRGRVMSVFTLTDTGMTPLGSMLVGGLAGMVGAQAALAASGTVVVAGILGVAARFPRLRRA